MADTTQPPPRPQREPSDSAGRRRFTRRDRILDKAAYGRVFKNAKRSRDQYFTVLYRRKTQGDARLGLAIAKKHCKLATGRNRIKRLIRESFRHNKHLLTGLDIVVINTRATHLADNKTLAGSLDRHWRQCNQRTAGAGKN